MANNTNASLEAAVSACSELFIHNRIVTTTSLQGGQSFDKRHDNVLRAIRVFIRDKRLRMNASVLMSNHGLGKTIRRTARATAVIRIPNLKDCNQPVAVAQNDSAVARFWQIADAKCTSQMVTDKRKAQLLKLALNR